MKIAVVGTGAMGSVYAALLASAGHEVWGIDRWREHVDAIREEGLRLDGPSGERVVRLHATTDAAEVGEARLVVIATKALDVQAAAEAGRPLVGTDTLVLSIQNGLGGPAIAAAILGEPRVAIGVAGGFGASIVAPGKVRHHGLEYLRMGERKGPATPRIEAVAQLWREAGFNAEAVDDIERVVWETLVCNVSFSGVCSVLERTIGEVIADPATWSVASRCAQEALEVALASGVSIGFEDAAHHVRSFGLRIAEAEPSMLLDVKAGRPCEIDFLNGAVARAGRELGVATPYNDVVTALVKAREATRSAARLSSTLRAQ
jgi:2-dehydropantoate 2-reductase